jgi:hypothetical protein
MVAKIKYVTADYPEQNDASLKSISETVQKLSRVDHVGLPTNLCPQKNSALGEK